MTRRQVAERLGKSQATVRRIEGVLLHPTKDARGVHRFDSDEVEALAHSVENGQIRLWQELRGSAADASSEDSLIDTETHDDCANCTALERQLKTLRDELEQQRDYHRRKLASLQAEWDRERAEHDADARELTHRLAEFMELVGS